MSKTIWVVANWKSNKNIKEALDWVSQVGPELPQNDNLKVVVCPPFIDVEEVKKATKVGGYPLMVGVQDLSPFEAGSYTGEEAASIMEDLIEIAILGHSERRQNFSETDEMVAKKVEEAQKHHILPLVCVQDANTPVPEGVQLVAFEPPSAIGTGHPDTPEDAAEVARVLREKHGSDLQVLYGGSVTSENARKFLEQDQLNGLLIGHASLDPIEFIKIVKQV